MTRCLLPVGTLTAGFIRFSELCISCLVTSVVDLQLRHVLEQALFPDSIFPLIQYADRQTEKTSRKVIRHAHVKATLSKKADPKSEIEHTVLSTRLAVMSKS